ncbi:MAG TPA: RusA family crossover junction endodeoxyribonuclease [Chitinophagaceae bacterium]|nr:RusA family crossover junction endodeoxyribonuclease [Chitinophagaceae bacterium]
MNGICFGVLHQMVPYVRMTRTGKFYLPRPKRYLESQRQLKEKFQDIVQYEYDHEERKLFPHTIRTRIGKGKDKHYVETEILLPIPASTPFDVEINFYYHPDKKPLHYCDLDNLIKAVMDAGNKVIFGDDRWCDGIVANRIQLDEPKSDNKDEVFVEVEFTWLS